MCTPEDKMVCQEGLCARMTKETIDLLMWGVALMSVTGTIANIYRRMWCFYLWAVGNLCWVAYDIRLGAYPQAALMFIYFLLSLWGIYEWNKKPKEIKNEN